MMFERNCVGIVVILLILLATWFVDWLFKQDANEDIYLVAWIVSTIGFGICVSVLLYQNGILV